MVKHGKAIYEADGLVADEIALIQTGVMGKCDKTGKKLPLQKLKKFASVMI